MAVKKYLDLLGLANYHKGLLSAFTSDLQYGDTYTLLSTEPAGWEDNYTSYYTKEGKTYALVPSGDSAPTFATNTYYSKDATIGLIYNTYPNATVNTSTGAVTKGNAQANKLFNISTSVALSDNNLVTSDAVAQAIQGITSAMVFKGGVTLTADSTDTTKCSIATDSAVGTIKKGYTFKITTIASNPEYTGTLKVGDTLIADKDSPDITAFWTEDTDWTVVPSGDEPTGDLTNVVIDTASGKITDAITSAKNDSTGVITLSVNAATTSNFGVVKPDGTTLDINNNSGAMEVKPATLTGTSGAMTSTLGGVKVSENSNISLATDGTISVATANNTTKGIVAQGDYVTITNGTISANIATSSAPGVVSPDGTVITVDGSGNITVPKATSGVVGVVKPDGTTITVETSGDPATSTGKISVVTATAGTGADGTKGIVTTASNSSALSITDGSIAVKVRTETDSDTTLGIDSNGLYVQTITNSEVTALFG